MTVLAAHASWIDASRREPEGPLAPLQLVAPDGSLTEHGRAYGVDATLASSLYRDMVLGRRLDSEGLALQRQGELSLWLMSWGQEAAQVGSIRALRPSDMVFPSYREHVAAMCRGITPGEIASQWRGVSHSGWRPDDRRFHIYSLVLGTQTLHAAGYATGVAMSDSDEIVAVYFGDGAASQGDVNEALNWSAAKSLPLLFFCQNNQWAISTPTSQQMGAALHQRAAGFGMTSFHVDGNDVLAVHAVTQAAADHIRSGGGPAFIEAQTYRRAGHSSSDDPGRYRTNDEVASWELRDPVTRMEALLRGLGISDGFFGEVQEQADQLATEMRAACRSLPRPDLADLFDNVYAEAHPTVTAERRQFLAHRASLEGV